MTQTPPDGAAGPSRTVPRDGFRTFLHVLVNTAVANVTTSFLWFALTFWIYVETRNVIATGVIGASYMIFISLFSMLFGTLVDRFRKKAVMVWATLAALAVFVLDALFFIAVGEERIADLGLPWFWIFAVVLLAGSVVEQLRGIALSTTVTLLVPEERHGNANGMVGAVQGVAMLVTSVFSGLSVGFLGMGWTLLIGIVALALTLVHLVPLRIPEERAAGSETTTALVDVRGGWLAVRAVPGLLALVLFTMLNNLFSGVAMAVMDPYGIDMYGVEGWGFVFALASTGFIVGGAVVAKKGVGKNPIRTILIVVVALGFAGAISTIRELGWLYIVGVWLFMALMPAAEAAEQTVIQRVVPYEKQGRVFGFAMTFEAAAAPITALMIAPLAELVVIPYMRTDAGQRQWEWLLGTGDARGIALLLLLAGLGCIALGVVAMLSPQYRRLSARYRATVDEAETREQVPV
ncbi:MFS transporter [Glycomyces harbinensis]|uniref:MFS transporter, DHA3 family, multidrug efflux protein n=1 Tax=Glycomyces harbinensis TaxID=58114 RepID=A0A1G7AT20_9ACTN|nr:MFS transporter [Glycomyces harbinensis]SDE18044.1 MFS transporter, DHA3 family, multidrug efflux protein [Glycomyces harbinensis]